MTIPPSKLGDVITPSPEKVWAGMTRAQMTKFLTIAACAAAGDLIPRSDVEALGKGTLDLAEAYARVVAP